MNYTIITGASSGIGLEFARIMAANGHNLVLVARSHDTLTLLKQNLEASHAVKVEVQTIDLSKPGSAKKLYQTCKEKNWNIDCLVNNAGYGDYGPLDIEKVDGYQNMLQLNILCLTELTTYFVNEMKVLGKGRILNVGSIASFLPIPNFAVYAASKAYVRHFTEALNYELRGTGVSATLLSPGVTETGFVNRAQMQNAANANKGLMDAKTVALAGYKAMMKRQLSVTPGWKNKLMGLGCSTMPSREFLLKMAGFVMRDTSKG